MKTNRQELEAEILAVENEEILVASNDGTFGAEECRRVTGSGDPQFGTYKIFECIGSGKRKVTGRDPDDAPGRQRRFRDALGRRRRHLSELHKRLRQLQE